MQCPIKNIGKSDRIIRIVLGLFIIILGFYLKTWWGLLGVIPLLTGITGFCALYTILKINTINK